MASTVGQRSMMLILAIRVAYRSLGQRRLIFLAVFAVVARLTKNLNVMRPICPALGQRGNVVNVIIVAKFFRAKSTLALLILQDTTNIVLCVTALGLLPLNALGCVEGKKIVAAPNVVRPPLSVAVRRFSSSVIILGTSPIGVIFSVFLLFTCPRAFSCFPVYSLYSVEFS